MFLFYKFLLKVFRKIAIFKKIKLNRNFPSHLDFSAKECADAVITQLGFYMTKVYSTFYCEV